MARDFGTCCRSALQRAIFSRAGKVWQGEKIAR